VERKCQSDVTCGTFFFFFFFCGRSHRVGFVVAAMSGTKTSLCPPRVTAETIEFFKFFLFNG
jgi:hypothetical protein